MGFKELELKDVPVKSTFTIVREDKMEQGTMYEERKRKKRRERGGRTLSLSSQPLSSSRPGPNRSHHERLQMAWTGDHWNCAFGANGANGAKLSALQDLSSGIDCGGVRRASARAPLDGHTGSSTIINRFNEIAVEVENDISMYLLRTPYQSHCTGYGPCTP